MSTCTTGKYCVVHPERAVPDSLTPNFNVPVTESMGSPRSKRPWKVCCNSKSKSDIYHLQPCYSSFADLRLSFYCCRSQGKIKHIGLSEVSATTLRRAVKIAHVDAVQLEYSPFSLECEQDNDPRYGVKKACQELGIALVAYSPLGWW